MTEYLHILQQYFGYKDFRSIQREIIESIGNGQDTLGLMPTGGGKSLTFQVPALAQEGVCIVITPLIALMKDQVDHLRHRGIRADAIYSGRSRAEIIQVLENCIFGGVKLLYVSPERLHSELFQTKLRHMQVSFITVDEAHCISQWGYDFRPSYLEISKIRQLLPDVPVLALTATATPKVIEDIQEKLKIQSKDGDDRKFSVFRMSFERKNLAYIVRKAYDKEEELLHILRSVTGSAIVYTRSRKHCKEVAQLLKDNDISATFYHAGLDAPVKDQRQNEWQQGNVRVIVATNAFGMGIDKPDVRVVIHIDCPDSIEAYFQEAGRAGRDGKKAYAVLLYNKSDQRKLLNRVNDHFPEKPYIIKVYEHLAYYYQMAAGDGYGVTREFNIDKFCRTFHHFPVPVDAALRILSRAGYLEYETDPDNKARLRFLLDRNELYRLDENMTPEEDAVITSLLRCYGGLFTDYTYIDEALIAMQASLSLPQVYVILKRLSERHILDFIPRRKTPYITYAQRRQESEFIVLSKEVYEYRKEQFTQRIDAMLQYVTTDEICRSRMLLRYFGEERTTDCKQCDVCQSHRNNHEKEQTIQSVKQQLLNLLDDKKDHTLEELLKIDFPHDILDEALQQLTNEEIIKIEGCHISYNLHNS